MDGETEPVIVAFVADLMFASRIESAAKVMGFRMEWIGQAAEIARDDPAIPWRQLGEHLSGQGAVLIEKIVAWQPALLIFDLGNSEIPWQRWIALLKSAPATRRIPVLCYGSHVEANVLHAARQAGADGVTARSRFASALPTLLEKYARRVDRKALQAACERSLSPAALKGLDLFNQGEYFEAHEFLEEAWNAEGSPGRELYQAILQVAVAYLQIERGNYAGARKMFLRMGQWIDQLPESCRGIALGKLRQEARTVEAELLRLGPQKINELDRSLLKPVDFMKDES